MRSARARITVTSCIISGDGPGLPKNEVRPQLCYLYDVYPTLCELAGLQTPETVEFKSLQPTFKEVTASHRDDLYFAFMDWQRAVRDTRYKLIEYCVKNKRHTQLFDLQKDPYELNNLAASSEHAKTLTRLRAQLKRDSKRYNDGNVPFPFTNAQGKAFWQIYESVENTIFP